MNTPGRSPSRSANNSMLSSPGMIPPPSPTGSTSSNLLSNLDFKTIDEMDPSLGEGHRIVFDKEIPVEMRTNDSNNNSVQDVGALEAVKVKVLVLGDDTQLYDCRVELSSEADLFFHFTHSCNRDQYSALQQQQNLMVDFNSYPKMLAKMLNSFLSIFVMGRDGKGQLNFVQNMEYKFVELLSLEFDESAEHVIRQQISFRYNSLKSRVAIMQARLQDVNSLVKLKSPSLLLQLQRNVTQGLANSASPTSGPNSTGGYSRGNNSTNLSVNYSGKKK
ncbi:hypothetical protein AKO1_012437 [Acrasis kona]|uniref:Spindle assembly abnormal protein 6 N-terminal domain-containing protein n=1 Tax=Acrasis kona TaxID=1008807 RepID=A0AAW2YXP5_9EUKA